MKETTDFRRGAPRQSPKRIPPIQASAPAAGLRDTDRSEDHQAATLTKSVYEQLRTDVLSGRLRPGEKLGAGALRKRFNTGSSPVREALNRLLSEGFVALEEQKGFRVAPVSREELSELVTARCWIDGAAVRESVARFDTSWEENLILALHRLAKTTRSKLRISENSEWENRHKAFHMALIGGCGTHWIVHISEQLFDAAERYRLLGVDLVPERNELEEHRAIVDACMARDADTAVELLKLHYGRTYDVIVNSLLAPPPDDTVPSE
ncbi:MAG: FCD domain-containing protein [Pseudomonadota bacterium]|nr:FCD domain-containing protein [Pseudomonadota bacterium]